MWFLLIHELSIFFVGYFQVPLASTISTIPNGPQAPLPPTSWPCMPKAHMQFGMCQMTQTWWQWQPNWIVPPSWDMPALTTPIPMVGAQPLQQIPRWHVHPNAQQLLARWSLPLIGRHTAQIHKCL